MIRKTLILVFLVLAALATQPLGAHHVRPPGMALGKPSVIAPAAAELNPSVIPAWVQALGSIGAILVAIWISDRAHRRSVRVFEETRRREEDDRRRKARSLALALCAELLEMKAKINGARGPGGDVRVGILGIPPVLVESIDRLYLLDEAGDHIQQFLATARQFERMVTALKDDPVAMAVPGLQNLGAHLNVMESALDEALELIGPIHDGTD